MSTLLGNRLLSGYNTAIQCLKSSLFFGHDLSEIFYCSQFEEKFEEVNGVEPSMSFPLASSSGSNENAATEMTPVASSMVEFEPPAQNSHRMSSDPIVSQDNAGGIMRIVPSDINVSSVFPTSFFFLLLSIINIP